MSKILVVHTSLLNIEVTLEKVKKLHTKSGPFTYCIILSKDDLSDSIKDPNKDEIPELLLLNSSSDILPEGSTSKEISSEITGFEGCGIYKFSNNLTLGYLTYNANNLSKYYSDLKERISTLKESKIDILITEEWSKAISKVGNNNKDGNQIIDTMVSKLHPRYHFTFSNSAQFTEIGPFIWRDTAVISRTFNIPEYGKGKKWAYAFQLNLDDSKSEIPSDSIIENPYIVAPKKRSLNEKSEEKPKGETKLRKILPEMCHFCFSNKDLQDHMIVSISNNAYVTIAKGPLSIPYGDMNFAGHCLIIPIEHIPKLNNGETSNIFESKLYKELLSYEKSIVLMNYRKYDMSSVSFEINSERSIHYHKQVIPIPKHLILKFQSSLDRQCYFNNKKVKGNANLNFDEYTPQDEKYRAIVENPKANYIQFSVYETSEDEPKVYLAEFEVNQRLDLQFGRRVLAFLLHVPKRVKWDSPLCLQSPEEETKEVQLFQKGYKDYDIAQKD